MKMVSVRFGEGLPFFKCKYDFNRNPVYVAF